MVFSLEVTLYAVSPSRMPFCGIKRLPQRACQQIPQCALKALQYHGENLEVNQPLHRFVAFFVELGYMHGHQLCRGLGVFPEPCRRSEELTGVPYYHLQ